MAEVAGVLHRDLQVERVPGRAGLDAREELAEIADTGRERCGALGPGGIVAEHVPELLQVRAAARARSRSRSRRPRTPRSARRANARPSSPPAGVQRERPAAPLRRRHDLVAVGCEDARRGRVDRAEHHRLHATCENADTPARLATRGRYRRGGFSVERHGGAISRHRPEATRQRERAAERREPRARPHAAGVGEQLEQRAAHEPVAEAARASPSRSSRAWPR